jgi:hypothetical protein
MVTGYDHLAFLIGVIFFLYKLKDIVLYVSLFTLGHSATLLAGVLGGIRTNPWLIDAIIGLSVVYKHSTTWMASNACSDFSQTPKSQC